MQICVAKPLQLAPDWYKMKLAAGQGNIYFNVK